MMTDTHVSDLPTVLPNDSESREEPQGLATIMEDVNMINETPITDLNSNRMQVEVHISIVTRMSSCADLYIRIPALRYARQLPRMKLTPRMSWIVRPGRRTGR